MFYDGSECNFLVAAFADVEPPLDAEVSQLSENDYLEIGRDILKLREEDFHYFLPRILCLLLVRSDRQILEDVFLALAVQELKDPHFLEIMRQYRSVEAEKSISRVGRNWRMKRNGDLRDMIWRRHARLQPG
jgi:hypothetical protein